MRRSLLAAITLILAWVLGSVSSASSSSRHGRGVRGCDLFASPTGSDRHGHGTFRRPFKSAAKLDRKLLPGETGCLRGGTYGSTRSLHRITSSGSPTARITIRSFPGETATIRGYVYVGGSYTTLSYVRIDGSNRLRSAIARGCHSHVSQPLIIAGHDDVLEYDNYFQSIPDLRGNGSGIGFWGRADNTMIRYSKIHDVGQCKAEDHLIYLARGNNVQIYDNWLWNDAHGRGVQLYPGPTNARIFNNV